MTVAPARVLSPSDVTSNVPVERRELMTADGYRLATTRYGNLERLKTTVVIAGCIGARQSYYRHFASYLALNGFSVITFDYRGIGGSRQGPLRGFDACLEDWAERDLEAVVNAALAESRTAVVGHSFGGHAFGLLSQVNSLLGLYTFASGAGHHSYMSRWEGSKVRLMWNLLGPPLTRAFGYLPSRLIGLGQDLPLGVFHQWRAWCSRKDYFFGDPSKDYRGRFSKVRVAVHAVSASDDPWSPPLSVRAFMKEYTGVSSVNVDEISPQDLGVNRIGHMGYFRPQIAQPLWADAAAWLSKLAP